MIQAVHINNYQSHRDTELQFAIGINVIVGASDSGKTAILRAMNWVRANRPLGESYVTQGTKDSTEVSLTVLNKTPITILRSRKKANVYRIGSEEYAALRGEVPPQVETAINLEDVNFQRQLSPHFLILDAPGAVAKALTEAIHLEEMDKCVAEATRQFKATATLLDDKQKLLKVAEENLAKFPDLKTIEVLVETAEGLVEGIREQAEASQYLRQAITDLQQAETSLQSVPAPSAIDAVEHSLDNLSTLFEQRERLSGIVVELEATEGLTPIERYDTALEWLDKLSDLKASKTKLEMALQNLTAFDTEDVQLQTKETDTQERLTRAVMNLTTCPMCAQELKGDATERVLTSHFI